MKTKQITAANADEQIKQEDFNEILQKGNIRSDVTIAKNYLSEHPSGKDRMKHLVL